MRTIDAPTTERRRRPHPQQLRLFGLVALAAAPLVIVIAVGAWRVKGESEQRVDDSRLAIAHAAALTVRSFIGQHSSTARTLAVSPGLVEVRDPTEQQKLLDRLLIENPDWEGAGISSADGWNIASTGAPPRTLNIADRAYFQDVLRTGMPVISPGVFNRRTGNATVVLAVPLQLVDGQRGVLIVALATARLREGLRELTQDPSVEIVVVDSAGAAVVPGMRWAALEDLSGRSEVGAVIQGGEGRGRVRVGDAGEQLVAYAPALPGWGVLVYESVSNAYGPARAQLAGSMLLAVSAVAGTALLGWFLGGRVGQARERERAALGHAEQAARERDDCIAAASHDLKNPLATIQGHAQLLQRSMRRVEQPDPPVLLEGLERIEAAAKRMTAQIDAMLDVARLQGDQPLQLNPRPTDLVALTRRVVDDLQATSERHTLQLDTAENELTGVWDEVRIERVLANLVANAIKHSPDGGVVTVAVLRAGSPTGEQAAVRVTDYGVGIPAADLPHIFVRFRRGSNVVGRMVGTGIGLAGARRIVEQHSGSIAVESEEGKGSTFTMCLPLNREPPDAEPVAAGASGRSR